MNILQVNSADVGGGAERIARMLLDQYRARGHQSWLAVGNRRDDDRDVLLIPQEESASWRWLCDLHQRHSQAHRAVRAAMKAMRLATHPFLEIRSSLGIEEFHHPGSRKLLDLPPAWPDVLHCHNLHGQYFDLRTLASFSRRLPTFLTLHDAWLLSGHCAHSFDCTRWKTGCGRCPDLTIPPRVQRDSTAYNWKRKRKIYSASRLYVATPSQWLMDKVQSSMLTEGLVDSRVIHNGADLSVFHPANKAMARAELGLPPEATILLFAANGIRTNVWKDFRTMREAIERLSAMPRMSQLLYLGLGERVAATERIGSAEIRLVPFEASSARVALYYQAADIYVHAARIDTFPNTVIEALACGLPVVATAVGGIPEQIRTLADNDSGAGPTGILTPAADSQALAQAIATLVDDQPLRARMAANAADDARRRFDLTVQADAYLAWYQQALISN